MLESLRTVVQHIRESYVQVLISVATLILAITISLLGYIVYQQGTLHGKWLYHYAKATVPATESEQFTNQGLFLLQQLSNRKGNVVHTLQPFVPKQLAYPDYTTSYKCNDGKKENTSYR